MKSFKKTLLILFSIELLFSQLQLGTDLDGEASGDLYGSSVSMDSDGDRVAIGGYNNDGTGTNAGHVRVYSWNGSSWSQLGSDIDGEAAGDQFGFSVSLDSDGDRLAVGGNQNDANGSNTGHVRVFSWNGSSWSQLGSDIDGETGSDLFGYSVSLDSDGDRVAIGGARNGGTASDAGHVRVYSWNGSSWSQLGSDIDGEATGDQLGSSVSLDADGDRVAIGARFNDGTASNAGHVRVYSWNGSSWSQLGSDIDGEASNDYSGISVSLNSDGDRVAIGANGNDGTASNAGHVRVYSWGGSSWAKLGSDIDGEGGGDQFGHSVSLDYDGDKLAVGAKTNGGNGTDGGHVRIYHYLNNSWTQFGNDIDSEAAGDYFGISVSLDSAGVRFVAGGTNNDGTASNAGHARVYAVNGVIISGTAGFRMLSTPVSDGTYTDLLNELWTQGMTGSDAAEASGDNVWTFGLGSGAAGTWSAAGNLGDDMVAGAGFLVYVFADNNYDGTDDLPKTLSVSGSENSGNVTYPASGSIDANQYGLSGNPYYSTIDWDDVTRNNVESTVYVYNNAKSGGAGYINWNGSSGDLTNGLIAPFQGFWVQATSSGSGTIQVQTADKATSAGTFYRMLDTNEEGSMYFEFSTSDGGYDKVWFSFNSDGDKDKDTRDAYKLMPLMASSRLLAMSYADEHSLDINNLPFSNDTDINAALDVMFLNLEETNYTLLSSDVTATWDISQLPDHIEMVLIDQVTGDVIHLDHMSSYSFTTEEEAGFSAVYDNAVASYPVSESPRFIVQLRYGALDSDSKGDLPKTYSLSPVYPNPFNPSATVQFDIREWSRVTLDVYDIKGALVESLLDRKLTPGSHRYRWRPSSISAGVYFLRLTTPDEIFTQKVTYVK